MLNSQTSPTGTALSFDSGIATITLNRPDKRNAFDDVIISELREHLVQIKSDSRIRVAILKAEGKHFCAGADLQWMKRMAQMNEEENQQDAKHLASLLKELNELPIPTLALVQGAAFGGAVGLIACCDIAIGTNDSRYSLSEVKLGLSPATISPYVIAAVGVRLCRRLFLTAEVFDGQKAHEYGLLHELVSADNLSNKGNELAQLICQNGPHALAATKQLIDTVSKSTDPLELFEYTSQLIARLRVSDEGQEGITAFFDKRPPHWCDTDSTG